MDVGEIQFGLVSYQMCNCKPRYYFDSYGKKQKKNLWFSFIDLKKAFDQVPEDVYGGLWEY